MRGLRLLSVFGGRQDCWDNLCVGGTEHNRRTDGQWLPDLSTMCVGVLHQDKGTGIGESPCFPCMEQLHTAVVGAIRCGRASPPRRKVLRTTLEWVGNTGSITRVAPSLLPNGPAPSCLPSQSRVPTCPLTAILVSLRPGSESRQRGRSLSRATPGFDPSSLRDSGSPGKLSPAPLSDAPSQELPGKPETLKNRDHFLVPHPLSERVQ